MSSRVCVCVCVCVCECAQITKHMTGTGDYDFLERAFHKLMLNFAW